MGHPAHEIRAAAIRAELDRAASEYKEALGQFEGVRQQFEAAKEKFASVRRLAHDVLPGRDWSEWQLNNEDLWLVGLDIGAAILQTLRGRAVTASMDSLASKGEMPWDPSMTSGDIVEALDAHGFEFRTAAPRREVHAALLHLKGVEKSPGGGRYSLKEAREIYKDMSASDGWPEAIGAAEGRVRVVPDAVLALPSDDDVLSQEERRDRDPW